MKVYKSKLNIKFSDYTGTIVLWMIAIVCTLGFAAIFFQLWLAKLILDNWEVEVHEENEWDWPTDWEKLTPLKREQGLDKLPPEGGQGGHY